MAIEVEHAFSGLTLGDAQRENAQLGLTDTQAVQGMAGLVLVAAGLIIGTGFAAGYYTKRAFFCRPRRAY